MKAFLVAGVLVNLAAAPATVPPRDYGTFGATCAPTSRMPSAPGAADAIAWPRPTSTRLTLVVDVTCPSTLEAVRTLVAFQRRAPRTEIEVLIYDPSAWTRIARPASEAIITSLGDLTLRWEPARLARMRLAAVPYFRVEDPAGRVVAARGVPSLEALVGALR